MSNDTREIFGCVCGHSINDHLERVGYCTLCVKACVVFRVGLTKKEANLNDTRDAAIEQALSQHDLSTGAIHMRIGKAIWNAAIDEFVRRMEKQLKALGVTTNWFEVTTQAVAKEMKDAK